MSSASGPEGAQGGGPAPNPNEFPGNFTNQLSEDGKSKRIRLHYLDHAGSTLFSADQMQQAIDSMSELHLNPHTCDLCSKHVVVLLYFYSDFCIPTTYCSACDFMSVCRGTAGEDSAQLARQLVLGFLNAPPGQYDVIFTAGATDSLRLLAESFEWQRAQFLYTVANHTYVLMTPACTTLLMNYVDTWPPVTTRHVCKAWLDDSNCVRPFAGYSRA